MDLCDVHQIKKLLAKYDFRFSKSKGQNFLKENWVPQEIAAQAGLDKNSGVLEIGPGFGCLTQELCALSGKVVSLEVDESLRPVLSETMKEKENLTVYFRDAMQADLTALVQEEFSGLIPHACANLPYNITSPILTKLLKAGCFQTITVMVQKEVAERICAQPGGKEYGVFSVLCQYYAEPEFLFEVPAECFIPQPKVTSAVVRLTCRKTIPWEIDEEAHFFRTVKAAFALRRKTLTNSLMTGFHALTKEQLKQAIIQAGFSPSVRGETLDIPSFARLSHILREVETNMEPCEQI